MEKMENQSTWCTIHEKEIFSSSKKLGPARLVLLQGEAGVGKTTFVQRWCYQWATRLGIDMLHELSLIIVLEAKQIKGSIEDAIKSLFPEGERKEMYKYIKKHQENCMIVIEALDEQQGSDRSSVERLLNGDVLPRAKVLVTGRTDQMNLSEQLFDRIVELKGLQKEQVRALCDNLLSDFYVEMNDQTTKEKVKREADTIEDHIDPEMLRNPLLCSIVCFAQAKGTPIKGKMTRTQLFCSLLDCLEKNKMDLSSNSIENDIQSLQFLALCYELGCLGDNITEENLQSFGLTEQNVLQHGLLVKSYTYSFDTSLKEKATYSFMHEQISEFLAAKAILDLQDNQKSLVVLLCKSYNIGVLQFLAGLTSEKMEIEFLVSAFVASETTCDSEESDAPECSIDRCSMVRNLQESLDEFALKVLMEITLGAQAKQIEIIQTLSNLPKLDERVERDISHQCACPFVFSLVLQGEKGFDTLPLRFLDMILSDVLQDDAKDFNIYHRHLPVKR